MSKYINADECEKYFYEHMDDKAMEIALLVIDDMPAADVQEVKRGRWLRTDAYPHRIYCSNCYGTYALDHWGIWIDGSLPRAYCPNCGAKMDEVGK